MGVYKGKSVDEAIENGLLDLNLKKEDVHIHVIEKGQAGIFGFFEKEAEVEQKSAAAAGHLDNLADDTAGISDEQKDLEKQALPLCGAGNNGFADGDRPGQAEAENSQRFQ